MTVSLKAKSAKEIKMTDVMSRRIISIEATATVADALVLMRRHNMSSLVVSRRDEHDEHGLLEIVDIARDVLAPDHSPERTNVYEVMSKPVFSVPGEMNVVYAVRLLTRYNMTRVLVIDHARNPIGIVTLRDLVLKGLAGPDA